MTLVYLALHDNEVMYFTPGAVILYLEVRHITFPLYYPLSGCVGLLKTVLCKNGAGAGAADRSQGSTVRCIYILFFVVHGV